jgi:hypothetical protein
MECKLYPAFGYVLARNWFSAGEVISDEIMTNNVFTVQDPKPGLAGNISNTGQAYVWFLASGQHTYQNLVTGELDVHEPGWCNLVQKMSAGAFEFQSTKDSEYVCFSPVLNAARTPKIPDLEFVEIEAGETATFPIGTKLYVLEGELDINGKSVVSMRQVHVRTGDITAKAKRKTYGYIFKV